MIGYAIGNGLGDYQLKDLPFPRVACNFFYREQTPDYLIALDKLTVGQILSKERPFSIITKEWGFDKNLWVTLDGRAMFPFKAICNGMCNNSGILAVAFLAHVLKCTKIYMLQYDFYQGPHRHGYAIPRSPTFARLWSLLGAELEQTELIRVGDTSLPILKQISNMTFMSHEEFADISKDPQERPDIPDNGVKIRSSSY
jgi:hypothetical protein